MKPYARTISSWGAIKLVGAIETSKSMYLYFYPIENKTVLPMQVLYAAKQEKQLKLSLDIQDSMTGKILLSSQMLTALGGLESNKNMSK